MPPLGTGDLVAGVPPRQCGLKALYGGNFIERLLLGSVRPVQDGRDVDIGVYRSAQSLGLVSAIKRQFCKPKYRQRRGCDAKGEVFSGGVKFIAGHDTVDESGVQGCLGINSVPGEQEFVRLLLT